MYLAAHLLSTAFFIMMYDTSCAFLPTWCYHTNTPSIPYRAVNGVKGTVLGMMSVPCMFLLVDSIRGTHQLWWLIPYISTIYASLDMAALLVLKDMHMSTTIHHVTVQCLHTYLALNNFDQSGLARPIVTFACFSCLAFLANIRLALRGIPYESPQDKRLIMTITNTAWQVYIVCCTLNAVAQAYLLYALHHKISWVVTIAYGFAVIQVTNDDIILIKWLHLQKRKMCSRFKEGNAWKKNNNGGYEIRFSADSIQTQPHEKETLQSQNGENNEEADRPPSEVFSEEEDNISITSTGVENECTPEITNSQSTQ